MHNCSSICCKCLVGLKCAVFHLLLLHTQPWTPPNWLSGLHTPTTTNPHLHLAYNPTPKPPKRQQHKWIVYCVSNIPDIPQPQKESRLIFDQYASKTTEPKGHTITGMFSTYQILQGHTHTCRKPPYQHFNCIILVYPCPTHIPTPHEAPNSELVWPLRILPARPWLAPLAETMATSWE